MVGPSIQELLAGHPEILEAIALSQQAGTVQSHELDTGVGDGAFSAGHSLEISTETGKVRVFVARPNGEGFGLSNHIAQHIETHLESHRSVPGTMEPLHLFVVTETGQVVDISRVAALLSVAEHLPAESVNILQDLRTALSEKWSNEQIIAHFGSLNEQTADILAQVHSQEIPEDVKQKAGALYSESLWRMHSDRELLAGVIHRHNFKEKKWITLRHATALQSMMVEFEHLTRHKAERLRPLHGDPWWRNAFRTPDGKVALIDQSRSAYGEPAIDVALSIGDPINQAIVRQEDGDGPFRTVAQRALQLYLDRTQDQEVLTMLPMTYAYKAFAFGVNNPMLQDDSRLRLVATGFGCLHLALEALRNDQPFAFNLNDLETYTAVGLTEFAKYN